MGLPVTASIWSSAEQLLREALAGEEAMSLVTIDQRRSPLGPVVFVGRVAVRDGGGPLPRALRTSRSSFIRVLDRFYLPETDDPAAATALFEDIADSYESLIDPNQNLRMIEALLRLCVRPDSGSSKSEILDFGCGPGLSVCAARSLGPLAERVAIVGTDASLTMLARAERNGLATIPLQAVLGGGYAFDSVIASYVLHLGLDAHELTAVCRTVKSGGMFVANYFHATTTKMRALEELLRSVGGRVDVLPAQTEGGPVIRFVMATDDE